MAKREPWNPNSRTCRKAWREALECIAVHPEDETVLLRATERFFGPQPAEVEVDF